MQEVKRTKHGGRYNLPALFPGPIAKVPTAAPPAVESGGRRPDSSNFIAALHTNNTGSIMASSHASSAGRPTASGNDDDDDDGDAIDNILAAEQAEQAVAAEALSWRLPRLSEHSATLADAEVLMRAVAAEGDRPPLRKWRVHMNNNRNTKKIPLTRRQTTGSL